MVAREAIVTLERVVVATAVQQALCGAVQRAWADFLGLEAVGPDDDFFELGGNSLVAAAAVSLLGERLGIDLAVRALFEAPTPAEMAELLDEMQTRPPLVAADGTTPFLPDWVVSLQPEGAGRPVFLFPGGLGGKWILKRDAGIATLVGRRHPFYGFRRDAPPRHAGVEQNVPAMAAAYVAQIRQVQGRGPYLLYGVCSGGALAWEAAAQLLSVGEAVAGLLFFEAPLRSAQTRITPAVPDSRPALTGRVPAYVPEPLPVALTLLMTEAWHAGGKSDGWLTLAAGGVETVLMPGDSPGAHNLYAGREHTIARHLQQWIARAEALWPPP